MVKRATPRKIRSDAARAVADTDFLYRCSIAILIGIVTRLWLWQRFIGSADAHIWRQHADHILAFGLATTYEKFTLYNHPPLMGWLAAFWAYLTGMVHGDLLVFARWVKIVGLLGEMGTLVLLWRFATPRAAAAYALSPVAILISGFHGNTDPLCASLILGGAIAADRERWFWTGVLFAAALNVKLIAILILPIVFLSVPWRSVFRFTAGLALAVIPYIPPALAAPKALYRNIFNYGSPINDWGLIAFLVTGVGEPRLSALHTAYAWYVPNGKFVVVGSIFAFALWAKFSRRMRVASQVAIGVCLWLILTPGFGIQYLIYATPLLCLVDRRYAWRWSCTAGALLATVYWMGLENVVPARTSWMRLHLRTEGPAMLFGLLAWSVLVQFVWTHARRTGPNMPNAAGSPIPR